MNEVFPDHVGLDGPLRFMQVHTGHSETQGLIRANCLATRYDTLRIAVAVLDDWNSDNCVGKYLKDIYANGIGKGAKTIMGLWFLNLMWRLLSH